MRDDCSCLTSRVSAGHILALGLDLAGAVHHVVFHLNEDDISTENIAAFFRIVSRTYATCSHPYVNFIIK
jgi:hypothetical protein